MKARASVRKRTKVDVANRSGLLSGRVLVVAFEGWNDAGDAASSAVRRLKDLLDVYPMAEVDGEYYFDYQFNRPVVTTNDDGNRTLVWPSVTFYAPTRPNVRGRAKKPVAADADADAADAPASADNSNSLYLLLGTEPSHSWKSFAEDVMEIIQDNEITGVITLGAMLADVPHTRPIAVHTSSENAAVRAELDIERSSYEGPVGILSVITDAAETAGIPTLSVWASVPHYVHNTPSPKATLALIDRLEELVDVAIPRGELIDESVAWENGINQLASDDDDMAAYIEQLERARDTVDSPEASGDAIAEEFEKYLRRRDGKQPPQ